MQDLQKRFLHTLMYHHMSHKFDTVAQGSKTIQELMNNLMKCHMNDLMPDRVMGQSNQWNSQNAYFLLSLLVSRNWKNHCPRSQTLCTVDISEFVSGVKSSVH